VHSSALGSGAPSSSRRAGNSRLSRPAKKRGKGGVRKKVLRRRDHIFASYRLDAIKCRYVHHAWEDGLSDLSAMLADVVSMEG